MTVAERAEQIQVRLEDLYPKVDIPLNHRDAFTLLMAVLLSAQTTDKKVNQVTPTLFEVAPDPLALSQLDPERILEMIRPLGLAPQKARHLAALGHQLQERFGGVVPRSLSELETLPGVGHKTASVVMSQAFGEPAFPVDTHIYRLATRWGLSEGKNVAKTEADLKKLYRPRDWGKLHLQFIYYGREYCPALRHQVANCPICNWLEGAK